MNNKKNKNEWLVRLLMLLIGSFLLAIAYNYFQVPNNIVAGGMSGLGVICKELFGIKPSLFLAISTGILLLISFIFLGYKKTSNTIIGSISYPLMVALTENWVSLFPINISNTIIIILTTGILMGVANGIIFKNGYTTGGSDVLVQIVAKYGKTTMGTAQLIVQTIIIAMGGLVFGLVQIIYAIIMLYINSIVTDRIMLGVAYSKMILVLTDKKKKMIKVLNDQYKNGTTSFVVKGGYMSQNQDMIMTIVPVEKYSLIKSSLFKVDKNAFYISHSCYEVNGGSEKQKFF